ncbi:hypothetical protein [Actinokineospora iranica]|uniref:Uncharacterized protein n=1 Tax=Actinokineospora iranica TaxID=1271860 RepID=A0A1G6NDB7_9PSEU|nr:hypothetical protein [Actinokineospora iranica]SDC65691.1 hypothetical protein SAMN05216174_103304 [Actinokineospora iranica]
MRNKPNPERESPDDLDSLFGLRTLVIVALAAMVGLFVGLAAGVPAGLAAAAVSPATGLVVGLASGIAAALLGGLTAAGALHGLVRRGR